ncbi:Acid protease [Paramyrothecium foliicola]|nr:Acid protease [Paramyrothecium foliicola]
MKFNKAANSQLTAAALCMIQPVHSQGPKVVVAPMARFQTGELFVASMEMSVGTPPQSVMGILDTGSSDIWFPETGSAVCNDPMGRCTDPNVRAFDTSKSSSFNTAGLPTFFANYVNGVVVNGNFMTEQLVIGNTTVANNTMGIARTGTLTSGLVSIFGVGPASLEASSRENGTAPYENLPVHLKSQGQTNSLIYSIYLNDFSQFPFAYAFDTVANMQSTGSEAGGSVVFGGMDAAKIAGSMNMVPLIGQQTFQVDDFIVPWTSFSFSAGNGAAPVPLGGAELPPALIDTGNPGLLMPTSVLDKIGPAIGVQTLPDGTSVVRCNSGDAGAKFTFQFQSATIDVPMSMIFIPIVENGTAVTDNANNAMCTLPLTAGEEGQIASLGAPLMSAAYTIFDMENQQLGFAQAKINATESNIQELTGESLKRAGGNNSTQQTPQMRASGWSVPSRRSLASYSRGRQGGWY